MSDALRQPFVVEPVPKGTVKKPTPVADLRRVRPDNKEPSR